MSGWVCVSVCVHVCVSVCVSLVLSASSPGTGAIRLWRSFKQLLSLNVEQLMRPLGTSRRRRGEGEEEKKQTPRQERNLSRNYKIHLNFRSGLKFN